MTTSPRGLWPRVLYEARGAAFLTRNLHFSCGFGPIRPWSEGRFRLGGVVPSAVRTLDSLHRRLREDASLNPWRRALYTLRGRSLVVLAADHDGSPVGFDMFYAREDEAKDGIVHEAFIGVLPEFRNQGLAAQMRTHAIAHFARAGLNGISSHIHEDNGPSLRAAQNCGFTIVRESHREAGTVTLHLMRSLKPSLHTEGSHDAG